MTQICYLLGDLDDIRQPVLALGLLAFVGGLLMMSKSRQNHRDIIALDPKGYIKSVENRKYRRRVLANMMITSVGSSLMSLYFVTNLRMYAGIVLFILCLLGLIAIVAMVDMLNVGLVAMTKDDESSRKAVLKETIRKRQKKAFENPDVNTDN